MTGRLILVSCFCISLQGCAKDVRLLTPLDFELKVIDITCEEVIDSLIQRLEEREITSSWVDAEKEVLSVGPFTNSATGEFREFRHQYELTLTCANELSTEIKVKAALHGLTNDGQWKAITNIKVIEKRSLDFLNDLDFPTSYY